MDVFGSLERINGIIFLCEYVKCYRIKWDFIYCYCLFWILRVFKLFSRIGLCLDCVSCGMFGDYKSLRVIWVMGVFGVSIINWSVYFFKSLSIWMEKRSVVKCLF